MAVELKICRRCGLAKPLDLFYKQASRKDGLHPWCKQCAEDHRRENRDSTNAAVRARHAANLEKYAAQRERTARLRAEQRRNNPEWAQASDRRSHAANAEHRRAYNRKYKRANRERATDRENERRARMMGNFVEKVDRRVVYERDHGICGICGLAVDPDDYAIDHIVPISKNGPHSYDNTQLAHRECNSHKKDRWPFA